MSVPDITFSIAPGNPRESTRTSVLYEHRKGGERAFGIPPGAPNHDWVGLCSKESRNGDRWIVVPENRMDTVVQGHW